jgi:flagellar biosynthesis protein FlhF
MTVQQIASFISPLQTELRALRDEMQALVRESKSTGKAADQIQQLTGLLTAIRGGEGFEDNELLRGLEQRLIRGGVGRESARELIEAIRPDLPQDEAEARLCVNVLAAREVRKAIKAATPLEDVPLRSSATVAAFVGPPGVGKTTTLAKIAARAALIHQRRVAIIGCDLQRVGAVQQLNATANAIGLPSRAVRDAEDLMQTVASFSSRVDLMLIDTGGLSARDPQALQDTMRMLSMARAEAHLLINADIRSLELDCILQGFEALQPRSLIITKVDQAIGHGAIYEAARRSALPVMYLADGPKVPDDLEQASPQRVASLVMGVQYN